MSTPTTSSSNSPHEPAADAPAAFREADRASVPAPSPLFASWLWPGLLLVAVAVLILTLRLSRDGLWDPHEVRLLEQLADASNPIDGQSLSQPFAGLRSRILLWPVALGIKWFGVNEIGARVPMLALSVLTLGTLLGFAVWLRSRTVAVVAGAVLLTVPLFFMSARLASQALLPIAAQLFSVFGLSLLSAPRHGRGWIEAMAGVLLSLLGTVLGSYAVGTLVGAMLPAGAVALSWLLSREESDGSSAAGRQSLRATGIATMLGVAGGLAAVPMVRLIIDYGSVVPGAMAKSSSTLSLRLQIAAAALVFGAALLLAFGRRALSLVMAALVLAVGVLPGGPTEKSTGYSPWLAGSLHLPASRDVQVDTVLRALGFALFPWSALLPVAVAGLFSRLSFWPSREAASTAGPATHPEASVAVDAGEAAARFARLLPLCWFALSYFLLTLHQSLVGDVPFVALPATALLIGGYAEDLLRDRQSGGALAGLCAGLCAVIVGRDLSQSPETYLAGTLTETLRWPPPLAWVGQGLLAVALLFAAVLVGTLWTTGAWRRRGLMGLMGLSALLAATVVHGLFPQLASHVSYRGLYTRYQQLGGGKLALFSVQQASGKIYGQNSTQLYTLPELMQFLAGQPGERTFAIAGSAELGGIDREAHLRGLSYFVVDDSNAQYLLLSNRLLAGEVDLNPLRRFVGSIAPQPRVPLHVVFDERIELVGYDAPPEIARGDELVMRLYYRVLAPIPTNYKIFLHFDGSGARWNGDHAPVGGKFQTSYWSPGTYITDEHRIPVGRMSQAPGYYQIFTGFWPGGDGPRMTVSAGQHEADQRVRIGIIRVK
ncbi:MAG: hypothetical protein JNJ46_33210 [Myxococcales bacterium]|nr:hypothetical protein [Myxococcales bacterium]